MIKIISAFFILFLFFSCTEKEINVVKGNPSPRFLSVKDRQTFNPHINSFVEDITLEVINSDTLPGKKVSIFLEVIEGNALLSNRTIETNEFGIARFGVTFSERTEKVTIVASVPGVKKNVNLSFWPVSEVPERIMASSVVEHELLPNVGSESSLSVIVEDKYGNKVKNAIVSFEIIEGAGTLQELTTLSNVDGEARTVFSIGNSRHAKIKASINDDSVFFNVYKQNPISINITANDSIIRLSWDNSSLRNFKKFKIYGGIANNSELELLAEIHNKDSTNFTHLSDFLLSKKYEYRVDYETQNENTIRGIKKGIDFGSPIVINHELGEMFLDDDKKILYQTFKTGVYYISIDNQNIYDTLKFNGSMTSAEIDLENNMLIVMLQRKLVIYNLSTKSIEYSTDISALLNVRSLHLSRLYLSSAGEIFLSFFQDIDFRKTYLVRIIPKNNFEIIHKTFGENSNNGFFIIGTNEDYLFVGATGSSPNTLLKISIKNNLSVERAISHHPFTPYGLSTAVLMNDRGIIVTGQGQIISRDSLSLIGDIALGGTHTDALLYFNNREDKLYVGEIGRIFTFETRGFSKLKNNKILSELMEQMLVSQDESLFVIRTRVTNFGSLSTLPKKIYFIKND